MFGRTPPPPPSAAAAEKSHERTLILHLLHPVLGLRLLDRLKRELSRLVQFQQLFKKFIHVGAFLGRRLDVFAFPHLL